MYFPYKKGVAKLLLLCYITQSCMYPYGAQEVQKEQTTPTPTIPLPQTHTLHVPGYTITLHPSDKSWQAQVQDNHFPGLTRSYTAPVTFATGYHLADLIKKPPPVSGTLHPSPHPY